MFGENISVVEGAVNQIFVKFWAVNDELERCMVFAMYDPIRKKLS